jgi:PAS domain S-box-containing protein
VENISDALYVHDIMGNIFDVNQNACRMTGFTREELIGFNLSKVDSPENIVQMPGRMKELLETGTLLFEGEHISKDNKRIPVLKSVAESFHVKTMDLCMD